MKWIKGPFILLLLVVVGLMIGVWRDKHPNKISTHSKTNELNLIQAGTYLPEPRPLPPFTLKSSKGTPFTAHDLKDYWTFVFFGYTRCPELCPRTLGVMQTLAQILGSASHTRFVLISIDPEQDTPEYLKEYFSTQPYQSLPFIGATGNIAELQKLTHTLGIYVQEGGMPVDQSHLEHSGALLLINPQGEFTALFNNPDNPQLIARDFRKVMQLYVHSSS